MNRILKEFSVDSPKLKESMSLEPLILHCLACYRWLCLLSIVMSMNHTAHSMYGIVDLSPISQKERSSKAFTQVYLFFSLRIPNTARFKKLDSMLHL
jgi:hypothetical protein